MQLVEKYEEVRCSSCDWVGTLDEAWGACESETVEDGLDSNGNMVYESFNVHCCPKCHKGMLEVWCGDKRLGSMSIHG